MAARLGVLEAQPGASASRSSASILLASSGRKDNTSTNFSEPPLTTMGNCVSNTGAFEPPGVKAVSDFVAQRDRAANESRVNGVQEVQAPVKPKCSICQSYVGITVDPWRQTRRDLLAAEFSDESEVESNADDDEIIPAVGAARRRSNLGKHGIDLKPCQHVFCGACLAQSIYKNLNVPFDPSTYGTKLIPASATPPGGKIEFPMGCPSCEVQPGVRMVEIEDPTARQVLGHCNMDEWNQARFMSTMDIFHCPHIGCNEPFDLNDVAPAPAGASRMKGLVQCPRCHRSLCKDCKVIWHERLSCEEFKALPASRLPYLGQEIDLTHVNAVDNVRHTMEPAPNTRPNVVPIIQWDNFVPNTSFAGAGPQTPHSAPYSPVTTITNSPSTSTWPPTPIFTYHRPESSTSAMNNPQIDMASAFDAVSRLTPTQQRTLVASLNNVPVAPDDWTREDLVASPPPYSVIG